MLANSEICHEIHHSWYCYGVGLLDYELELPGSPAVTGTKSDCEAPTVGFKLGLPHLLGHGLPPVERLPCNQRNAAAACQAEAARVGCSASKGAIIPYVRVTKIIKSSKVVLMSS